MPAPAPASLSILLYNVWNLPSCCTDGNSRARAKRISKYLTTYDVVILNEAFVNKDALLADTQFTHPYKRGLGRQFYTVFDSGVIVLSKFPIVKYDAEHCAVRRGVDFWAAKGIVFVRLQVSETQQMDVYGTHLQAGAEPSHQMARAAQSAQMAAFILKNSPLANGIPVVLAGDLNMGPVLDPTFTNFSGHYVSREDAIARNNSYVALRDGADLADLFAKGNEEDICRFLIRDLPYGTAAAPKLTYADWATRELSDTPAVVCQIQI
jgi:endonuclease/exonuclease/phosphatase family metal-dependent hydrolase